MGLTTRVYLARHAQSQDNVSHLIAGHRPTGLSESGKRQEERFGWRFRFVPLDVLATSDLPRAWESTETLRRFHPGLIILREPRLREQNMGIYEGRGYGAEWEARGGQGKFFKPEGGECAYIHEHNAREARKEILDQYGGARILFMTHHDVARLFMGDWMRDDVFRTLRYGNMSVSTFDFSLGDDRCSGVGDTKHLLLGNWGAAFYGYRAARWKDAKPVTVVASGHCKV